MKQLNKIIQFNHGKSVEKDDWVVIEKELKVAVENQQFTIMCSPQNEEELIVGFLYNIGLIESFADIESIDFTESEAIVKLINVKKVLLERRVTSGCAGVGVDRKQYEFIKRDRVAETSSDEIIKLSDELNQKSTTFKETGGVHASMALLEDGSKVFFDDIGRHNTFDKITGACLMKGKTLSNAKLMTTGRLSSEMIMKAAVNGVETLISRSAPTDFAIELAHRLNIELIGFARAQKYNRYIV